MKCECSRCGSNSSTFWYPLRFGDMDTDLELCDRCMYAFWEFLKEGSEIAEERRRREE